MKQKYETAVQAHNMLLQISCIFSLYLMRTKR